MSKVGKILLRVSGVLFEWALILLICFAFLIRQSSFQTYIAQQVSKYFSKEWKTKLTIKKVDINLFDRIYLEGVSLLDRKGNTLLKVASLEVTILEFGMDRASLNAITLNEGKVWVYKDASDGKMNFAFLTDYFASDDTTSSSTVFHIDLHQLNLKNTTLKYDDFTVKPTDFGFDPNHVEIVNLTLLLSNLTSNGTDVAFHIDDLKFKDQSGLEIKHLSTSFAMTELGLKLNNLHLALNRSNINAQELGYAFDKIQDKQDFLHKARILCKLKQSNVHLTDVSYLVPELKGMDEDIRLKGTIHNVPSQIKISDLDIGVRKNTRIKANLELPDMAKGSSYRFTQKIVEAKVDMNEINAIKLPGGQPLNLGKELCSFGTVSFNNLTLKAENDQFILQPLSVMTSIGSIEIGAPIALSQPNDGMALKNLQAGASVVALKNFNVGTLLSNPDLGIVEGEVTLSSIVSDKKDLTLRGAGGHIETAYFMGYTYHNLDIRQFELSKNQANLDISLNDPNAKINLQGTVNLGGRSDFDVVLHATQIHLDKLGFAQKETLLNGKFALHSRGNDFNQIAGTLTVDDFAFKEENKEINLPMANIDFKHSKNLEDWKIRSALADIDLYGSINPNTIIQDVLYSCSRALPSWFSSEKINSGKIENKLEANIAIKNSSQFTQLFMPELSLPQGADIKIVFDAKKEQLGLNFTSEQIMYDSIVFSKVELIQAVLEDSVVASLTVNELLLSDSLTLNEVNFFTHGRKGVVNSTIGWDKGKANDSKINWSTSILSDNSFDLLFNESRFSFNGYRWQIKKGSEFQVKSDTYFAKNFNLASEKNNQKISISGKLSNQQQDVMQLSLTNLNLTDLSGMFGLGMDISGNLGGEIGIANPFKALTLTSKLSVDNLVYNHQEIGNFSFDASYDNDLAAVIMKGNLNYRETPTVDFTGTYKVKEIKDNFDLDLHFNNTDLTFLNGFMDAEVVSNINGKLNGNIHVSGEPDLPLLKGSVILNNASAIFSLLGCRYTINGKINVGESGFLVNKSLSLKDEDGNNAALDIAISHDNFSNFGYIVNIDFENGYQSSKNAARIEKFLVLNTTYKEGDSYYGKAYAKGHASITGEGSSMKVKVDLTTKQGSKVIFPMYGTSELEDESIIHFVSKEKKTEELPTKVNYSGIDLSIGFNINPDADIRLVFNEQTQDEIRARAEGKLNLSLDAFNQMRLNGALNIIPGSVYNFTMGPARKPFEILNGTIVWKGDVEHADMKVLTSYTVKHANMLELMPGQNNEALSRQNTQCLLNLTGDLMTPLITFQLDAPQAPEAGKALLSRINSDPDELNRQFFSLMLFNKFQPLQGGVSANESAAFDLVESQINAALAQLSKNYQVKMDIGASNISTSVQKSFLNDRLIVSGSFGVDNASTNSATGGLIGDVSLEYLINQQGTFRVNAFNRSNGNTVKENAGPFTQGAGLSYHEDFNNKKDFILMQTFFDIFRKKENRVVQFSRKKKKTKVPALHEQPTERKEENE